MEGKVVVITGGTSGIGKALAEEFGSKGSKIVITGRKPEALKQTIDDLKNQGIEAHGVQADASNREDNVKMANEALQ